NLARGRLRSARVEQLLCLFCEGNDVTAILAFSYHHRESREVDGSLDVVATDDVIQAHSVGEMCDRPIDPDRAAQHVKHPAVENETIATRMLGRVVRFEGAKQGQRARADRVPVLTVAGHDHAAADHQTYVAVRAEIGWVVV